MTITDKTKIWAHRGASAITPENSMEAFTKAIELKADGIELDVQLTKDGRLVVIHDEWIDRTSDGQGMVKDYLFEEICGFNFNNNMTNFSFCRIPLLEEVLFLIRKSNVQLNIELKTSIVKYEGIEQKVLDTIKKYDVAEKVIISSFNHYSLKRIKEINESIKTGLLFRDVILNPMEFVKNMGSNAYHPSLDVFEMQLNEGLNTTNFPEIEINVWNVAESDFKLPYIKAANAIITNYPEKARKQIIG